MHWTGKSRKTQKCYCICQKKLTIFALTGNYFRPWRKGKEGEGEKEGREGAREEGLTVVHCPQPLTLSAAYDAH